MNLIERLESKRAELRQLGPLDVRSLTPSLKDFTHALTFSPGVLAVIAELTRSPGEPLDLKRWVGAVDPCDAAAIAVATDAAVGGRYEDLTGVATGSSTPLLMDDWVISREQVYRARLFGADAVLLRAGLLPAAELRALIEIASSLHMAAPVEVETPEQLQVAVAVGARAAIVSAVGPAGLDMTLAQTLLPLFPRTLASVLRGPFQTPAELAGLRGRAQAVWLTGPKMSWPEVGAFLRPMVEAAEGAP